MKCYDLTIPISGHLISAPRQRPLFKDQIFNGFNKPNLNKPKDKQLFKEDSQPRFKSFIVPEDSQIRDLFFKESSKLNIVPGQESKIEDSLESKKILEIPNSSRVLQQTDLPVLKESWPAQTQNKVTNPFVQHKTVQCPKAALQVRFM